MCTVTFIPVRGTTLITSNRDEKTARAAAIYPARENYNGAQLIFPRDAQAGGSWIGMKENGDAAVLLNGAFLPHPPATGYRRSRGLIFLDVLSAPKPGRMLQQLSLNGIEPFTMILFEAGCLYEFRWDGTEKFTKQLPAHRPHIWSSATLYDGFMIRKREQWFASFLNNHPQPTQQDVLHFHQFGGEGHQQTDLKMSRDNGYATVSITSLLLTAERGSLRYTDLATQQTREQKIEFLSTTTPL